jgi:hypothetical protein
MADRMRPGRDHPEAGDHRRRVKKLSDATRHRRPEIPWKRIAGMRDRLTHDYFGLDLTLIWAVAERDLASSKGHRHPSVAAELGAIWGFRQRDEQIELI